ncbi:MAG TPA: sensor histidine kinase [Micromonosporaceae bacterium]|nr:sensor histidine kinase [Micromonosporaceae bacterium]
MKRALTALTLAAYATMVVGAIGSPRPVPALLLGSLYVLVGTVGFHRVLARRRRSLSYAYVSSQLCLGYVVFVISHATIGGVLLLVVLVSQSVMLLPLPAAAVVVAVVPLVHLGMSWQEGLREGLGTLVAAVFAAALTELVLREQRSRAELTRAHERLREYAERVERLAAAQERNRVARDIHDGLGHSLTVVQMQVKAARAVLPDVDRADAVLAKAQHQAEEALAEVRRSVSTLREPRPPVPLPEALRALADEASAAGVPTSLGVSGPTRPLPAEAEESLFRAAQEGLTNVRKHAGATRAELVLDYSRPVAVSVEVRDDGAGLPAAADGAAEAAGVGLVGVRERAAHVGGRMSLDSIPGGGATLRVEVPG